MRFLVLFILGALKCGLLLAADHGSPTIDIKIISDDERSNRDVWIAFTALSDNQVSNIGGVFPFALTESKVHAAKIPVPSRQGKMVTFAIFVGGGYMMVAELDHKKEVSELTAIEIDFNTETYASVFHAMPGMPRASFTFQNEKSPIGPVSLYPVMLAPGLKYRDTIACQSLESLSKLCVMTLGSEHEYNF
jgi:hypothetical protein